MHALLTLLAIAFTPPTAHRQIIPFPRRVLAEFLADSERAVPGTRIDSPPFEAGGHRWLLSLYPFGGNADPYFAGRIGLYLKLDETKGAPSREVDAVFSLKLRTLVEGEVPDDATNQRGLAFRCGMTFCAADEAGNSVGRANDWGAHVYPTSLLLRELETRDECGAVVDVELSVFGSRPCKKGASLLALAEQTNRLPSGALRVGEVVVPLTHEGDGSGGDGSGGEGYRPAAGVEHRIMRLTAADGTPCFTSDEAEIAYLLPTSATSRQEGALQQMRAH